MSIDNALLDLDSSGYFPSEVEILAWHGDKGNGFIEYNDRPRIVEQVYDATLYRDLINDWVAAAAALPASLTLAQAKQVKQGFVEAIFHNKRMLPYQHLDGWRYEATDEAIAYMTSALASGNIEAAMSSFINELNNNIFANNTTAGIVNSWSVTNYNNWAWLSIGWNYDVFGGSTAGAGIPNHGHEFNMDGPTHYIQGISQSVGSGGYQTWNVITSVVAPPSTAWRPLNSAVGQSIAANNFGSALRAIADRRTALNAVRVRKNREIADLMTMAAVIAYDTTIGW